MNSIILMGRLTRDPQIRQAQTQNGPMNIAHYTLAVRRPGTSDKTDFIYCTAFGPNADFAQKWLHQGQLIAIEGSLRVDQYTDNQGQHQTRTYVVINRQHFTVKETQTPAAGNGNAQAPAQPGAVTPKSKTAPAPTQTTGQQQAAAEGYVGFYNPDPSELPF